MYCISEEQVAYILNDIRRNGVEMEDLQLNLLDHICCKVEQEFTEGDDFERFYKRAIKQLCNNGLHEIEEETINLLTFKNYYVMKKVLIATGVFSVFAFIAGSAFKFMYWPGASMLLTLGIGSFSLLFLPLLFILKAREAKAASDKFVAAIGSAVGAMFSLAILFIVQHWPGANELLFSAIGIAAFVLLPTYFFTGIRRPETKLNTILMSIILVGIIGLQFTLVRLRPSASQTWIRMATYAQNEELLWKMRAGQQPDKLAAEINEISDELKGFVLQRSIGMNSIPADFDKMNLHLNEGNLGKEFDRDGKGVQLLTRLRAAVNEYNAILGKDALKIPIKNSVLETDPTMTGALYSNLSVLNSITQLQMYLALGGHAKETQTAMVVK
jgi:hypothetical protein